MELKLTSTADGPRLDPHPGEGTGGAAGEGAQGGADHAQAGRGQPAGRGEGGTDRTAGRVRPPAKDGEVTFTLRGATVSYDAKKQEVVVNGHRAPAPLRGRASSG